MRHNGRETFGHDTISCFLFRFGFYFSIFFTIYLTFIQDDTDKYRIKYDAYNVRVERTEKVYKDERGRDCLSRRYVELEFDYVDKDGFTRHEKKSYKQGGSFFGVVYWVETRHKVVRYNYWYCSGLWFLFTCFYLLFVGIIISDESCCWEATPMYRVNPNSPGFIGIKIKNFFGYNQ